MKKILFGMGGLAIMGIAQAAAQTEPGPLEPVSSCGQKVIRKTERLNIGAHMQAATRLTLPSNIVHKSNSAPALWDVQTTREPSQYLWVRPKQTNNYEDVVGVSIVTEDGRGYDFVFQAYPDMPATTCWEIVDRRSPETQADLAQQLTQQQVALETERRRLRMAEADISSRLRSVDVNFQRTVQDIRREANDQARDVIAAFQYSINTAYDWEYSQSRPTVQLASAYDDGRRMYVRVTNDAYGVPSVVATGEKERITALTTAYNDLTGVLTIQGLYPELELRFGAEKIVVTRRSAR